MKNLLYCIFTLYRKNNNNKPIFKNFAFTSVLIQFKSLLSEFTHISHCYTVLLCMLFFLFLNIFRFSFPSMLLQKSVLFCYMTKLVAAFFSLYVFSKFFAINNNEHFIKDITQTFLDLTGLSFETKRYKSLLKLSLLLAQYVQVCLASQILLVQQQLSNLCCLNR